MATAVDVTNVPDIIEAQLTLSYSRLTELMQAMISRSNEHDDLLLDLRDTVAQLTRENAGLREQVAALTAQHAEVRSSSGGLAGSLAEVQRGLSDLTAGSSAHQQRLAAVEATVAQTQGTHSALQESVGQLTAQLAELRQRQEAAASTLETSAAFAGLWGTTTEEVRVRSTQDAESRQRFLLGLSPLRELDARVTALQGEQQQSQAAAAEERDHERSSEAQAAALQTVLAELQQRLSALEAGEAPGAGDDGAKGSVHQRLAHLEGRLQALLSGGDRGHVGEGLAVADVAYRVSLLEETVEGLPARAGSSASGRPGTPPPDNSATASPVQRPSGRGSLPPLNAAPRQPSRRVEQPVLESLRQGGQQPVGITVQQENGLRRRLAQAEENVALLEVHKAERAELQTLEEMLRASLRPHGIALLSGEGEAAAAVPATGSATATAAERGVGVGKHTAAAAGRPMFVPGGSVFLKDGANTTNATALYGSTH